LRASVFQSTRATRRTSNAWVSSSSFASALIPVRCADAASQVQPISTASSSSRSGQVRAFQNAVQPTAASSLSRTWANAVSPGLASWAAT